MGRGSSAVTGSGWGCHNIQLELNNWDHLPDTDFTSCLQLILKEMDDDMTEDELDEIICEVGVTFYITRHDTIKIFLFRLMKTTQTQ